jgi:hypothetical protein
MKPNILRNLLFIPLLAILFTGCNKWLDNEFQALSIGQLPTYVKGDTFLYKSIVTEDVDTFLVTDFVMDTMFNGSILFERTGAIFARLVGDTIGDDFFYIANEPNGAMLTWDSAYIYFMNMTAVLDTTMQGFDYSGLYIAEAVRQDTISKKLHKVYFDWEYGLVKYVHNSLDTYELFSRPE